MQKSIIIILSVLFLVSIAFANFIFLEYKAIPTPNSVTIEWVTKSESGVSKFVILRSTDDQNYGEREAIAAKGTGNNYSFEDDNIVFKDTQVFFYKIKAVGEDNTTVEETDSFTAHPNISGIYRTWGAIKAMFAN
jgi:hypothetical protein